MNIQNLKKKAKTLSPILRIGKNGITENVFTEVEKLLKKRELVKIKILNNCPIENQNEIIDKITKTSRSVLVSKVGFIFTIYKENRQARKK